ncbi:MAG: transporter [Desulfuromonas sp.]|nr:MAG: transporter [Desulfuromonas sp.]
MKNTKIVIYIVVALSIFVCVEPAIAGPGGKIASVAFETFWGRIILVALIIIFMPLMILNFFQERKAEKRARKDLRFMANVNPQFDWFKIQERAKDCFFRVHSGWENEDLSSVSDWMTDWYWQNQQMVYLDKWKKEGLVNICNVRMSTYFKPLLFVHRNAQLGHEDSIVVISIKAQMEDYLQNKASKKIVEGSKGFKWVETIWTFTIDNGKWKVSNIEEGALAIAYAKLVKELPNIESTIAGGLKEN